MKKNEGNIRFNRGAIQEIEGASNFKFGEKKQRWGNFRLEHSGARQRFEMYRKDP